MRKNRALLITAIMLCAMIISGFFTLAAGDQQVKIPYVVSTGGWWTGIAITNNSGTTITDMELSFTTDGGYSNSWGLRAAFPDPILPPLVNYATDLEEIAGYAMLVNTLAILYTGDGTKTLPSDRGSVILSHTGDERFSATVFIGGPDGGFAYQVFESTAP